MICVVLYQVLFDLMLILSSTQPRSQGLSSLPPLSLRKDPG